MDIAETYLDRPAGMYDVARGQCRSLSEDPKRRRQLNMPTASSAARSIRPLESVHEDELGEAVPTTHALFLPKEETLPSAPFPVPGKSGLPDAVTLTTASSSATPQEIVTSNWRSRRSVSRIRYGRKTVKIIRLDDAGAGFCRRRSPAPGHSQTTGQSRKSRSPRIENSACSGNDCQCERPCISYERENGVTCKDSRTGQIRMGSLPAETRCLRMPLCKRTTPAEARSGVIQTDNFDCLSPIPNA